MLRLWWYTTKWDREKNVYSVKKMYGDDKDA